MSRRIASYRRIWTPELVARLCAEVDTNAVKFPNVNSKGKVNGNKKAAMIEMVPVWNLSYKTISQIYYKQAAYSRFGNKPVVEKVVENKSVFTKVNALESNELAKFVQMLKDIGGTVTFTL